MNIGGRFLRLAPIASYALAQFVMVGYWAYTVSEYGVDPKPDFDPDLLGAFLITAIPVVPPAIILGMFDAAARHLDYPLLKALDALLIALFALAWIVPIEWAWLAADWDETNIPTWPAYLGVLIGAELGLILLVLVSVTGRLIVRRVDHDR
jgi:hypothetical protein